MRLFVVVAVLALTLAACAPTLESANEVGGVVSHANGVNSAKAFKVADDHCRQFGKAAQVGNTDWVYNKLVFACVAR
jgi:hypothetical protein